MHELQVKKALSPDEALGHAEAHRLVSACREVLCADIPHLVNGLFSKLDDALYDLADKSESIRSDVTYVEAMGIFRRRRQEILSLFLTNLLEDPVPANAARPQSGLAPPSATPDTYEAWIVRGAELEEALTVTNLISKAENRYQLELTELRRHLAFLFGQEHIDSRIDPIGPHRICIAFHHTLSPMADVALAIKLIAYKLFDKQVMNQLGPTYKRCCERAADPVIDPDAPFLSVVYRAPETSAHEDAPHGLASSDPCDSRAAAVVAQATTEGGRVVEFRDFQRLLAERKRPGTKRAESSRVVLGTHELVSALARIQESAGFELDPRELRRRLIDHLKLSEAKNAGRTLKLSDEDTLELIPLLFKHALQGNQIPAPLKRLIGRLTIPTLRVALIDQSFFEDKEHPARCLLNHLAQLTVGWNDDGDRSPGSLYHRIDRIVDQVVRCGAADAQTFAELDAELGDLLARERAEAQSQEVRAQQELELREHQHSTRQLVRMAINQRLRACGPVPDSIAALLYDGWQQVLLAAYLRGGAGGERWQEAMRAMDRLVWSVQPKVADEDRRELLRTIPELLRTLRESLAQVSYDKRRLARWFKELQALHITALRGEGPGLIEATHRARPIDSSQDQAVGADIGGGPVPPSRMQSAEHSTLTGLRVGSWIELWRENDSPLRAKLAWRSPRSGIYLFVDRHGHNALELTQEDLLRLVHQDALTILGDAPIVDRAMREMVRALMGKR